VSLKPIMNTAGRLGHSVGSTITGGIFVPVSAPSATVLAGGSQVYRGPLAFNFTGGSGPGFVPGSVLSIPGNTIPPTATSVLVDGLSPMRAGDKLDSMFCTGTLASGGGIGTIEGPVGVVDAGQSKVSAQ